MRAVRSFFSRWTTRTGVWIQRAQYAVLGLLLLGAVDYFAAYDLLTALFGTLGPGVAPLLLLVGGFLLYRGYRRHRRSRRRQPGRPEAPADESSDGDSIR